MHVNDNLIDKDGFINLCKANVATISGCDGYSFPKTNEKPNINYNQINKNHTCYDLIYNPSKTIFLSEAQKNGATIINGLSMLKNQAEESWKIWNRLS